MAKAELPGNSRALPSLFMTYLPRKLFPATRVSRIARHPHSAGSTFETTRRMDVHSALHDRMGHPGRSASASKSC
jgi:hypothetical protein